MIDPLRCEAQYSDEVFKEIRQERSLVENAEFLECEFSHCFFSETEFRNCRFVNCVFRNCDLSLVQVPGSTFSGVRFEESKVIGVDWTQAGWPPSGLWNRIDFLKCAISHSTFTALGLKGVQIRQCVATNVDFENADLAKSDFSGTDLSKSLFVNTNLTEADLSSARNYRIEPGRNILRKAKFSLPEAMSLLYCMDIILEE